MNGTERHVKEKFTGNVTFYLNTKLHRAPTFLQRNIRSVLAYHRRQLALLKKSRQEASMKPNTSLDNDHRVVEPRGTPKKKKTWSSREVQYILEKKVFTHKDPVLRIDVAGIRDRLARFRDKKDESEPPTKQARTSLVHATCSLTIWDSTSPTQDTVVEQTRKCEIEGRTKPSGERVASIAMSSPFLVRLDQLQPTRERVSQTNPEPLFSMQIVLMAANDSEIWPPVEMKLPTPKVAKYIDQGGLVRFPLLVAKWHRLPQVPETDQEAILDLLATQDNTKYKPKLGLKIDASWTEPASPLTLHNMEIRNGRSSTERSRSSEYEDTLGKFVAYTEWVFEGLSSFMPKLKFEGYTCPMCNGQRFRDAGEFHFHLINSHDLFKFKFSQKFETNSLGQSVAEGLVRIDVADNYEERAANSVKDFREMKWQRPNNPFDLEAYLKGDESWLGKSTKRNGSLAVTYPESQRLASRDQMKPDVPLAAITRPPDQVPDLVRPPRKRFRVPKAPRGIQFYRLTAKRPLVEGEMISESDDDIDEEWLQEKHSDTIDSFTDTLPQEKRFIQRYDRHMLQEDISSDVHSGEALIRFCRLNKAWLQLPTNKIEFHKKVAALKLQGSLSSTTILACSRIINAPLSPPSATSTPNKRKGKGKSKAEDPNAMDIDTPTPNHSTTTPKHHLSKPNTPESKPPTPPAENDHLFGRCALCRKSILDVRDYIRCSNPFCTSVDNHLSCVGLDARPSTNDWFCEPCVRDGVAAAAVADVVVAETPSVLAGVSSSCTLPATANGAENVLVIRSRESTPMREGKTSKGKAKAKAKAKTKIKPKLIVIHDNSSSEENEEEAEGEGGGDTEGSDDEYDDEGGEEGDEEEEEGEEEEEEDDEKDGDEYQETEQEVEDSDKEWEEARAKEDDAL